MESTQLVVEGKYIEGGLTSVYQPGDVVINKPLKQALRSKYHFFISENLKDYKPGDRVEVSREMLVQFIEETFNDINLKEKSSRSIMKSFDLCGLNPFAETLQPFIDHLNSLSENKIYKSLMDNNNSIDI